jgi:hypothetical protein
MNTPQTVAHEAKPWIVLGARLGYVAKGIVYITIGLLAAGSALGRSGGKSAGSQEALLTLVDKPFGKALLFLVAIGLFCYAIWRIIDAVTDASGEGSDGKAIAKRISVALRAIVYGALGGEALRLATGSGGGSGKGSQHWVSKLMDAPFGKTLVVVAGAGVIGYGLYQISRAWQAKLSRQLDLGRMTPEAQRPVIALSRAGIGARGVVFLVIGFFIIQAGLHRNPGEVRDVGGALGSLHQGPFGMIVLLIVGLGLAAYGIYQFVNARYRRIAV